ncbi:MAG TPA: DinB family protein [Anaerolineales bacterium]|nr:DinB family protein [Anaerolineales bacterium]
MKELIEYRVNLMKRLEDVAKAFRAECLSVKDPYTPLEGESWNVHQIAVHTRDVDKLVYGLRVHRTALEDNPEFSSFDGEAYMAEHYDPKESLSALLNDFVSSIEALVELLRGLPAEGWSRLSRHTTLGSGLTLQTWVEKSLAHIQEHLETVKKANNK